eukprot:1184678-Prorocentrum_minimum.AAC.1
MPTKLRLEQSFDLWVVGMPTAPQNFDSNSPLTYGWSACQPNFDSNSPLTCGWSACQQLPRTSTRTVL